MITSRRGKTGGWKLTESPDKITLLQVVEALEPESLSESTSENHNNPISPIWEEIQQATRNILDSANLESLASDSEPMFYI